MSLHVPGPNYRAAAPMNWGELVGLAAEEAGRRVQAAGFVVQILSPGNTIVDAALRPNRVLLIADNSGRVVRVLGSPPSETLR